MTVQLANPPMQTLEMFTDQKVRNQSTWLCLGRDSRAGKGELGTLLLQKETIQGVAAPILICPGPHKVGARGQLGGAGFSYMVTLWHF